MLVVRFSHRRDGELKYKLCVLQSTGILSQAGSQWRIPNLHILLQVARVPFPCLLSASVTPPHSRTVI